MQRVYGAEVDALGASPGASLLQDDRSEEVDLLALAGEEDELTILKVPISGGERLRHRVAACDVFLKRLGSSGLETKDKAAVILNLELASSLHRFFRFVVF